MPYNSNWCGVVRMDQEEIERHIADILQQEIDAEILCKLFTDDGWTLVFIPELELDGKVGPWLQANVQGQWRSFVGPRLVFESADDATLFRLTWS